MISHKNELEIYFLKRKKKKIDFGTNSKNQTQFTSRKPPLLQLRFQLLFDYKPSQKLHI